MARQQDDAVEEANILGNIGINFYFIGDYERAISYHSRSLEIDREQDNLLGIANSLNNLGSAYSAIQQHERALEVLSESLSIYKSINYLPGQANALANQGIAYESLDDIEAAISVYREALPISQRIGNQHIEANVLNNLSIAMQKSGRLKESTIFYNKALSSLREIGDRRGEGIALGNIGYLHEQLNSPVLAIAFYKQSVNLQETVRRDISDPISLQRYTDAVANTYRRLANLLLHQGRIPEAQQVLDLLKLEELREFTDTTRATWTGDSLQYTDPEQAVIAAHDSIVALGGEIVACEDTDCAELDNLDNQLEALKAQYDEQVAAFEATIRANRADDEVFQNPDNLSGDAEELLSAYAANGQTALLIYPFVLEDKLWLVYAAQGSVIGSIEVPVSQGELSTTVQRLGDLLTDSTRLDELQATSQQLYNWLIQPLESELADNDIDHLVFVNDRVTRYIPMAALYDGEKYLLERYTISTVLAPGLTDTTDQLESIDQSQVLGLGLTQAVADFSPLPAVDIELDAIVRSGADDALGIYPGQVLLNDAFTLDTLKENVRDHRVLHMATHAAFVPGRPEESFIVLGNGEQLKVSDIEAMERRLGNLHLVVLSACQTALGGAAGDGTEIAGISSYFLEKGRAEAVMASLWRVDDVGTSLLMQRFYEILATGQVTKAEALRQAQLSLLYGEAILDERFAKLGIDRGGFVSSDTANEPVGLEHPYYWAPFVLIGNGL